MYRLRNFETNLSSHHKKLQIARAIVEQDRDNYEFVGIGIGNAYNALSVDMNKIELEKNPNAEEFFLKRYQEMIPFDVPSRIGFTDPIRILTG